MNTNTPWVTAIFLLSALTQVFSQDTQAKHSTPLTIGDRYLLNSSVLKETRALDIYLPEHYRLHSSDHVYPVMIVLEGRFANVISSTITHLSASERLPEMIVVSFPSGKYYAPNLYANGMWGPDRKQLLFDSDPELFSQFFEQELFPYLEKNFRAAKYRMILGTSSTAVYPLHAFWKSPDLFQAHIAIAAGDMLGMGYSEGQSFVDTFAEHLARTPGRKGNLYIASADSDAQKGSTAEATLLAVTQRLAPFQSENLKIKAEIIPNQVHYDALLPGLMSALEMVFPLKKWSKDFREYEAEPGDLLENIDAHYQKLSAEYGFLILPPAVKWNSGSCLKGTGRRLLRAGKTANAVKVYERWVAYHPKSAEAHYRLATALEANKQLARAVEVQQAALVLLKGDKTTYLNYLASLKAKINAPSEAKPE